jgi:HAT1-interacting factor 1
VLSKHPTAASSSNTKPTDGRIHFGGDPESDHEGDTTVDLMDAGAADAKDEEGEDGEGENDEDDPEDDFNAAWDVLDLARAYYDKQEGDDMKLKLADTYMCLGDVSLETGMCFYFLAINSILMSVVIQKSLNRQFQTIPLV